MSFRVNICTIRGMFEPSEALVLSIFKGVLSLEGRSYYKFSFRGVFKGYNIQNILVDTFEQNGVELVVGREVLIHLKVKSVMNQTLFGSKKRCWYLKDIRIE